jgi:hypothetical protein
MVVYQPNALAWLHTHTCYTCFPEQQKTYQQSNHSSNNVKLHSSCFLCSGESNGRIPAASGLACSEIQHRRQSLCTRGEMV